MTRAHRVSLTGAVIVCLMSPQWNGMLFASEEERSPSAERASAISIDEQSAGTADLSSASVPQIERSRFTLNAENFTANSSLGPGPQGAHGTFNFVPAESPAESSVFAGQVYQGRPYRMGRDRAIAAIMLGAIASIAGAAILVYANRPECDMNQFAGGCGYGTKVVGGAVLSGGIVGLFVGALTWK